MGLSFGGQYKTKLTTWDKKVYAKYTDVKCTVSNKKKDTDEYETTFSSFIRFIGKAHDKAVHLMERDRIIINNFDITAKWDAENKRMNINFVCFDFDKVDKDGNVITGAGNGNADDFINIPDNIPDGELPFE